MINTIKKAPILTITLLSTLIIIVNCSNIANNPAENAKKAKYKLLKQEAVLKECKLYEPLNAKRAAAGKRHILPENCPDPKTGQIKSSQRSTHNNPTPSHAVGLNVTNLVNFGSNLRAISQYRKATKTEVPKFVKAKGSTAKTVFKRLIINGATYEEAVATAKTSSFDRAVATINKL